MKAIDALEKIHYIHKLVASIHSMNIAEILDNPAVECLLDFSKL